MGDTGNGGVFTCVGGQEEEDETVWKKDLQMQID